MFFLCMSLDPELLLVEEMKKAGKHQVQIKWNVIVSLTLRPHSIQSAHHSLN